MNRSIRRALQIALDIPARLTVARRASVDVSATALVRAYRRFRLWPGSSVQIGDFAMIEGAIVTEHPDARISIGARTYIGSSQVICASRIRIGDDVLIAWGCIVVDHDSHSLVWRERANDVVDWFSGKKNWDHVPRGTIDIGDKAWIGANVVILKNVTIGEGAVVGAGSVVTRSVPAWTLAAGNPARVIRPIPADKR